MTTQKLLLNINDMCEILGTNKTALRTTRWRIKNNQMDPSALPPEINWHNNHARWHIKDVENWLESKRKKVDEKAASTYKKETTGKRMGRPRKSGLPNVNLI